MPAVAQPEGEVRGLQPPSPLAKSLRKFNPNKAFKRVWDFSCKWEKAEGAGKLNSRK